MDSGSLCFSLDVARGFLIDVFPRGCGSWISVTLPLDSGPVSGYAAGITYGLAPVT